MQLQMTGRVLAVLIAVCCCHRLCGADVPINDSLKNSSNFTTVLKGDANVTNSSSGIERSEGIEIAPYHVSVRGNRKHENYGFLCCGTILTDTHVAVVSSCVKDPKDDPNVYVVAGSGLLNPIADSTVAFVDVKLVYRFQTVQRSPDDRDVAVFKLEKKLPLGGRIYPVHLSDSTSNYQGCIVSGWGQLRKSVLDVSQTSSDLLIKKVTVRRSTQDKKVCHTSFPASKSNEICVEASTCEGDEGAPLVCDGVLQGFLVERDVSFNRRCLADGNLDSFVNVTARYPDLKVFLQKHGPGSERPISVTDKPGKSSAVMSKATLFTILLLVLRASGSG